MASPRTLATTDILLSSLTIPIRVYSATKDPPAVAFNLLHASHGSKPCGSRVKQQYVCPADNALPEREELVKGYEVGKDRYVVFSSEELAALEEPTDPGIHVMEFIELARIDPIYFSKAFYLGPDKGGERGYRLLLEVMGRMGKVALARYAMRGKERLVVLRPFADMLGGRIVLQQLLHAEEVREPEEEIASGPLSRDEVRLASELVAKMSAEEFHPERYPDEQYQRTLALIEQKVAGKEITAPKVVGGRKQFLEIAEALAASLVDARKKRAAR